VRTKNLNLFFILTSIVFSFAALLLSSKIIFNTDPIDLNFFYPKAPIFRFQAMKFLEGHLSLGSFPAFKAHDWVLYHDKLYHLWGFGVAILFTPFILIEKILQITLPIEISILFVYLSSIYSFASKIIFHFSNSLIKSLILPLILFCTLSMIGIFNSRLEVYEYVILLMQLHLLLSFLIFYWSEITSNRKFYYLSLFLLSFTALIRPTGFLYIAAFAIVYFIFYYKDFSVKLILILFFFPALQLFLNYYRYGNILEFGHTLNAVGIPIYDPIIKFYNSFKDAPFIDAIKELYSCSLNTNWATVVDLKLCSFQASYPRWRESYFAVTSPWTLLAWLASIVYCFHKRFYLISVYSLLCFIFLLLFYLYSPAIVSRYYVDFYFCLSISNILLVYTLLKITSKIQFTICYFLVTFIGAFYFSNYSKDSKDYNVDYNSISSMRNALSIYQSYRLNLDPSFYSKKCSDITPMASTNITHDFMGWQKETCQVEHSTLLYLYNSQCYLVVLKPENEDFFIQAKLADEFLTEISRLKKENTYEIKFCQHTPSKYLKSLDMLSLNWISKEKMKLSPIPKPNHKLIEVHGI